MKRKFLLGAALALVAALACGLIAGCSNSSEAQKTDASKDSAQYAPIAVSYLNKSYYEDIIVGDNKGFFKDCGPEVTLNPVEGSGQQSVEALLAGSVDIACTGQGPVADAIKQKGDEIVILAANKEICGEQAYVAGPSIVVVPYDKKADNKADVKASFEAAALLKGGPVVVGVQNGSTTANNFKSWLKFMEIDFTDFGADGTETVKLVDMKANTLAEALATGNDIDMMAASQPYPSAAIEKVPGAYQVGTNLDNDAVNATMLITTKKVMSEKEASIKAFLKADGVATDYLNTNAADSIKICADAEGVDEAAVKAIFDNSKFKVTLDDEAVKIMLKACKSKGVEIDEAGLKAQMPLLDWVNGGMKD